MKRLALVTAAALAGGLVSLGTATPAYACDGKIDVACNETPCAPDNPCTINICVLYVAPRCVV